MCLQDLETDSDSPTTAIVSEEGPSSMVLTGFADGAVKILDRRLDEDNAIVRTYSEHSSWVQAVKWRPGASEKFLTAR